MGHVGNNADRRGDIMRRLRDLERDLREAKAARRLENASVGHGGIRVHQGGRVVLRDGGSVEVYDTNDSDEPEVRLGRLSTGGYGLEQRVGAAFVPLASLAGGAVADAVATEESLTGGPGSDSGFVDLATLGPSVTFETFTGRWLLMMFAEVETGGNRAAARMGYEATGAQAYPASNDRSSLANWPELAARSSAAYVNVHTGEPGEIIVTAKYRLIASESFNGTALWSNRAVVVIPW